MLGKYWRVVEKEIEARGYCDPPSAQDKKIELHPDLRGEEHLATVIHEVIHAAIWSMDEEYVEELSTDLARILWRFQYRRDLDRQSGDRQQIARGCRQSSSQTE